jgi:hypothetical protein
VQTTALPPLLDALLFDPPLLDPPLLDPPLLDPPPVEEGPAVASGLPPLPSPACEEAPESSSTAKFTDGLDAQDAVAIIIAHGALRAAVLVRMGTPSSLLHSDSVRKEHAPFRPQGAVAASIPESGLTAAAAGAVRCSRPSSLYRLTRRARGASSTYREVPLR